MALSYQDRIVLTSCQVEELPAQLLTAAQLPVPVVKRNETPERSEALVGLPHLLAQRVGPAVGFSRFWRYHALRGHQQLS